MIVRVIGAVFLVTGCGGVGLMMGFHYRREIRMLRALFASLQEMEWELKYRLTPLPELCGVAAAASEGTLRELYSNLKHRIETGVYAEISGCMNQLLQTMDIPNSVKKCMKELGKCLGRYDLEGQLQGIEAVKTECQNFLEELEIHRSERLRSYQTLGLCAGVSLVIIFV